MCCSAAAPGSRQHRPAHPCRQRWAASSVSAKMPAAKEMPEVFSLGWVSWWFGRCGASQGQERTGGCGGHCQPWVMGPTSPAAGASASAWLGHLFGERAAARGTARPATRAAPSPHAESAPVRGGAPMSKGGLEGPRRHTCACPVLRGAPCGHPAGRPPTTPTAAPLTPLRRMLRHPLPCAQRGRRSVGKAVKAATSLLLFPF